MVSIALAITIDLPRLWIKRHGPAARFQHGQAGWWRTVFLNRPSWPT